jgi:hypothetical protein
MFIFTRSIILTLLQMCVIIAAGNRMTGVWFACREVGLNQIKDLTRCETCGSHSGGELCLLYSSLLYRHLETEIYRTIILPVVLYGCETWSLTLREERRLRVFENRMLRRVFGAKRDEVTRVLRNVHNEELNDLYSSPDFIRVIQSRIISWECHVARMGGGDVYTGFWWEGPRERDHLEDPGVDGRIIRWIFRKWDVGHGLDRAGSG